MLASSTLDRQIATPPRSRLMTTKPAAQEPEVGKVFGFTGPHRRAFVRTYVLSKTTFFWRDVHSPRFRLFIYEIVYSLCRAMGRRPLNAT